MKVSKTVSIEIELLQNTLKKEGDFSKAVSEALTLWLAKSHENSKKKTAASI
jgi:hypothetical protein